MQLLINSFEEEHLDVFEGWFHHGVLIALEHY